MIGLRLESRAHWARVLTPLLLQKSVAWRDRQLFTRHPGHSIQLCVKLIIGVDIIPPGKVGQGMVTGGLPHLLRLGRVCQ